MAQNVNLAQMLPSTPLRQRDRWLSGVEATVGGTNVNFSQFPASRAGTQARPYGGYRSV